jgi:hypothetical protein
VEVPQGQAPPGAARRHGARDRLLEVVERQRHGLPFLERFRSADEVFAELARGHLARKKPTMQEELRFSCYQFCFGQREEAVARVERVLAMLGARGDTELTAQRRATAQGLLEHYRSRP